MNVQHRTGIAPNLPVISKLDRNIKTVLAFPERKHAMFSQYEWGKLESKNKVGESFRCYLQSI